MSCFVTSRVHYIFRTLLDSKYLSKVFKLFSKRRHSREAPSHVKKYALDIFENRRMIKEEFRLYFSFIRFIRVVLKADYT
jgi:hypothetical protein